MKPMEDNQGDQFVNSDDLSGMVYDICRNGKDYIPKTCKNPEKVAVVILSAAVTIAKDGRLMFAYNVGESVGMDLKMHADVFSYALKKSLAQCATACFNGFSEAWKYYEERD